MWDETPLKETIDPETRKAWEEAVNKKKDPPKPRIARRVEKAKLQMLNKLLMDYFAQRSALVDPNGQEAVNLFDRMNGEWKYMCSNFNRGRTPIKLRYEAFSESVEMHIKEEDQKKKVAAADKAEHDFKHWVRREVKWNTFPFRLMWYWIVSCFGKKWSERKTREVALWKAYYLKTKKA